MSKMCLSGKGFEFCNLCEVSVLHFETMNLFEGLSTQVSTLAKPLLFKN